jgi:hypothetical protein
LIRIAVNHTHHYYGVKRLTSLADAARSYPTWTLTVWPWLTRWTTADCNVAGSGSAVHPQPIARQLAEGTHAPHIAHMPNWSM